MVRDKVQSFTGGSTKLVCNVRLLVAVETVEMVEATLDAADAVD